MDYEEMEEYCERIKMYAKRTMDLYCDGKKWKWMAEHTDDADSRTRYMNVSNMLMDLFNKEVANMKI